MNVSNRLNPRADHYKETYLRYELAARIVRRSQGVIYKCDQTGGYKIAAKQPPPDPYHRAREKEKVRRLVSRYWAN